ncbi:uncharacterized protein LOC120353908 [Nilaparvata lugens]|uniref:uncharacterized protein LOC120353908 n=1 Tax=Nilaparvata lugens TaxID=108931 RepID=UPI00193E7EA7|nr:uncharacterized protein LOC120353908 [Nilaparvata lugens]XP_039295340.1 uncharacterized protein LOC120353908 [Nilaparvata lugens]
MPNYEHGAWHPDFYMDYVLLDALNRWFSHGAEKSRNGHGFENTLESSWEVDTKWTSQPQNNISNFSSAATPSSSSSSSAATATADSTAAASSLLRNQHLWTFVANC